jgi:hypothetical protein
LLHIHIFTPASDQSLFDFAIVSTGLLIDARLRLELSAVARHIKTWRDIALLFLPGSTTIQVLPYRPFTLNNLLLLLLLLLGLYRSAS